MPNERLSGRQAVDDVFADFFYAAATSPDWLFDPETGSRLSVDRLYPELGVAITFPDLISAHPARAVVSDGKLEELCRGAGISLVEIDALGDVSGQNVVKMRTALSASARRVAQQRGAQQAKLEILPRIAGSQASCDRLLSTLSEREDLPRQTAVQPWRRWLRTMWRPLKADWRRFKENRLGVLGLWLILLFLLMSISHPILRATVWRHGMYDPVVGYDMDIVHPSAPSAHHLLGTDSLGRDVLSMLLKATTSTFLIGITAALSTAAIGTAVGVVSAYRRGAVDAVFTHVSDAFLLLPAPLFMVIVGMRYRDIAPVPLGLIYGIIAGLGAAAIVLRAQAIQVVARPFIDAARIAGGSGRRVMVVHILPHMMPLAALYMMLAVTGAVVADAFIAFFGFNRNFLNWGTIIYSSFAYGAYLGSGVEWHVLIPPSLALSLFAASFYLLARGMHDLADPRLRTR